MKYFYFYFCYLAASCTIHNSKPMKSINRFRITFFYPYSSYIKYNFKERCSLKINRRNFFEDFSNENEDEEVNKELKEEKNEKSKKSFTESIQETLWKKFWIAFFMFFTRPFCYYSTKYNFNKTSKCVIHIASLCPNFQKKLLNIRDDNGNSLLNISVYNNNYDLTEFFIIDNNLNVNNVIIGDDPLNFKEYKTPLDIAIEIEKEGLENYKEKNRLLSKEQTDDFYKDNENIRQLLAKRGGKCIKYSEYEYVGITRNYIGKNKNIEYIKINENEECIKINKNEKYMEINENEGYLKVNKNDEYIDLNENEKYIKINENEKYIKLNENEECIKINNKFKTILNYITNNISHPQFSKDIQEVIKKNEKTIEEVNRENEEFNKKWG